jgi:hypothetical protein
VPSTSVHLPAELLTRLDRVAKRRGISRNRLITEACRSIADAGRTEWPADFFPTERLRAKELELLRSTFEDWLGGIAGSRKSKKASPF